MNFDLIWLSNKMKNWIYVFAKMYNYPKKYWWKNDVENINMILQDILTGLIPTHWKWYHSSHLSQQIILVSSVLLQMQ